MEDLTLEQVLEQHAKSFVSLGMASDYNGCIDSLKPAIINFGSEYGITEIMIGTLAMIRFARLVVKQINFENYYYLLKANATDPFSELDLWNKRFSHV